MSRPARIAYEGATYHVFSRGNARSPVFLSDLDRLDFLGLLGEAAQRFGWLCHAYCLMCNHYHLIIETPYANLSEGMQFLNGRYTQRFNWRHQRVGHVFQGRFKASLIQREKYFLEACRYVVLNPVRAGLCSKPSEWRWSSYAATASGKSVPDWLTTSTLWSYFGSDEAAACAGYREFVCEGAGLSAGVSGHVEEAAAIFREFPTVIGDAQFVRDAAEFSGGSLRSSRAVKYTIMPRAREPLKVIFSGYQKRANKMTLLEMRRRNEWLRSQVVAAVLAGHPKGDIATHLGLCASQITRILAAKAKAKTVAEAMAKSMTSVKCET